MGIDEEDDKKAAGVLNDLVPTPDIKKISEVLKGRDCVVLGAGPSLEEDLDKLRRARYLDKVLVAVDGATTAVLKYKVPNVIVTDFDGNVQHQLKAWRQGAWLVVHAHGDNIPQLKRIVPQLNERVIGTTQVKPFGKLFNFGGFTDGDRAAFMAHEVGATKIYLAGMDLGSKIGKYSGSKNMDRTLVKLRFCREMLTWLSSDLGARMINLTSHGEQIPRIPQMVLP
jgi:hypothetical protein